jgi:predicted lipid-binding transport protein (Tim44 family)
MNAIPNRRGLLLGAVTAGAAASVAAIPAIAAAETPDPIFARIEPLNAATAHIDEIRDTYDHAAYE